MSFSSEVKEELNKLKNLANKETTKYELLGYFATNHVITEKNKIKFSTENEHNVNRFGKLISNVFDENFDIEMSGKNFCITVKRPQFEEVEYIENKIQLNNKIEKNLNQNELCAKALVRGAFLGGGAISNPQNTYHLEILMARKENAELVCKILNKYETPFKIMKKGKAFAIYTKDGDEISKFLALIGANQAVLKFEEIRVYRDIKNNVNRKVNCETANLNKTIDAAMEQIKNIQYLKQSGNFKMLSKEIQELANLRLKNPEASLAELGKMLEKPIGKSGVNHRFKVIENLTKN